jgi:signal transduction histidine kinase
MSNAIKYTPEGGKVNLDVSVTAKELKISVSDTGCGIPKQDQDKIFGKLFRASNVRSVDGNGFGLFVVKGATEAQGGTITFESEENVGTKFIVILPVVTVKSSIHQESLSQR